MGSTQISFADLGILVMFIDKIRRTLIKRTFPLGPYYKSLLYDPNSYLETTGWKRSIREGHPADKEGKAVPWMNYPTIAFLHARLGNELSMFEFGSGYSTVYFSGLVGSVRSVEYDEYWFSSLKKRLPYNCEIIFVEKDRDGDYCRAIHKIDQAYDLVLVDGRDRVNCIRQSVLRLKNGGVIILDDSDRERYAEGFTHLKNEGFREITIEGIAPMATKRVQSTIFYKDHNCLGI